MRLARAVIGGRIAQAQGWARRKSGPATRSSVRA